MNIVLAGMPGSGKTTVAKALARLGFAVYDTDEEIVKEHGAINEIFSRFGEEYFRDIESRKAFRAVGRGNRNGRRVLASRRKHGGVEA